MIGFRVGEWVFIAVMGSFVVFVAVKMVILRYEWSVDVVRWVSEEEGAGWLSVSSTDSGMPPSSLVFDRLSHLREI